jgi:hypothetical protein
MSLFKQNKFMSWLAAAFAFCIWAITLDLFWTRVFINGNHTSEAASINHLICENASEIPVFGSSKAGHNYNPEVLGDDVFNYGMDGASLDLTIALMQIECRKNKRTPIVVDLTHNAFRESSSHLKFPSLVRQPEIRRMMNRLGFMRWQLWVPGLRYFGYYDSYVREYLIGRRLANVRTVRGYTVLGKDQFDPRAFAEDVQKRLQVGYWFGSDPVQENLLFEVIRSTPQRTFVIVFSPLHSSCFEGFYDPAGFARYLNRLRSFTNVVVLDWGKMELADDCFTDTIHLNQKGAVEFSRRLANQLRTLRISVTSTNTVPAARPHGLE